MKKSTYREFIFYGISSSAHGPSAGSFVVKESEALEGLKGVKEAI